MQGAPCREGPMDRTVSAGRRVGRIASADAGRPRDTNRALMSLPPSIPRIGLWCRIPPGKGVVDVTAPGPHRYAKVGPQAGARSSCGTSLPRPGSWPGGMRLRARPMPVRRRAGIEDCAQCSGPDGPGRRLPVSGRSSTSLLPVASTRAGSGLAQASWHGICRPSARLGALGTGPRSGPELRPSCRPAARRWRHQKPQTCQPR